MLPLLLLTTPILLGMTTILLLNWWTFPQLREDSRIERQAPGDRPVAPALPRRPVSLLVPARNEAAVIGETVRALLAQDYANLEILVLDDHSTDGTADRAREAAAGDARLRVLRGQDLPRGWLGKNWACQQLAEAAGGDILVFVDAGVHWQPGALRALLAAMAHTNADLLAVWPTQQTVTWGERLVVPLMALVVHAYLPVLLVHHAPAPGFAAANGQCMAFHRRAYARTGGHAAVRDNVLEDVTLARRAKARGGRLRMAEGNGLIACRMYHNWAQVRAGYAKNVLQGYGNAAGLLAATLFHWIVFLGPWGLCLLGLLGVAVPGWPGWPLALILLGLFLRAGSAWRTRQRPADALFLPLSVLLMTRIAAQALWWQWRYGGPLWKGRIVKREV